VVITYADDTNRDQLDAFGQWIGTSDWLTRVGPEYGVGAGTVLGTVHLTTNAPTAITSTQIESMINAGVTDGSLPSPPDHNYANVLYMVFFPGTTTVTLMERGQAAGTSCQDFGGYHSEIAHTGGRLAYAAVPDCGADRGGSELSGMTLAASHEYIEAATDPYPFSRPAYQLPLDGSSAWAFIGGEIGDLCELSHSALMDGPYLVQRIWSNMAAASSADPCVPADPTRPYFNVAITEGDVQFAHAGDAVTFTLTGFSSTPLMPWQLSIQPQGGNLRMTTALSASTVNNGGTVTLTVHVPTTATQGYEAFVLQSMESSPRLRQVWPIAVVVQ
jgi:hypothetical protein